MVPFDEVPQLTEAEPAIDALAELLLSALNSGLVVVDDRLAGFLSITDLARALERGAHRVRLLRRPERAP
jgi:CBS domain-containing protein